MSSPPRLVLCHPTSAPLDNLFTEVRQRLAYLEVSGQIQPCRDRPRFTLPPVLDTRARLALTYTDGADPGAANPYACPHKADHLHYLIEVAHDAE